MAFISPSSLSFQASDSAWNNVSLVLRRDSLIVTYSNSSNLSDDIFNAASFKDLKELEEFIRRFRPTLVRLQDKECKKVVKNMTVCAASEYGKGDTRFYDAFVQEVKSMDHKVGIGAVCNCKFVLFWLFGPNSLKTTDTRVVDICIFPPGTAHMDPTLSSFIKICREKYKLTSNDATCISKGVIPPKEVKTYKDSVSTVQSSKGQGSDQLKKTGSSVDFGAKSRFIHVMFIENLEKDLSPLTIVDFVKKHVEVTSQAHVFPSLSSESFARGMIVVDSGEDLQKLCDFLNSPNRMILSTRGRPWVIRDNKLDFLDNPAHIILSSRGRPWVITENKLRCGAVEATLGNIATFLECHPRNEIFEIGDKITIASTGTEEYEKGKKVKGLFLEFADHQERLHQRLAWEESRLLLQATVPSKFKLPKSENND